MTVHHAGASYVTDMREIYARLHPYMRAGAADGGGARRPVRDAAAGLRAGGLKLAWVCVHCLRVRRYAAPSLPTAFPGFVPAPPVAWVCRADAVGALCWMRLLLWCVWPARPNLSEARSVRAGCCVPVD